MFFGALRAQKNSKMFKKGFRGLKIVVEGSLGSIGVALVFLEFLKIFTFLHIFSDPTHQNVKILKNSEKIRGPPGDP